MGITSETYFAIIPEWILDADISAGAVRLYGILNRYAGGEGTCHPSRRTIAGRMHCHPNTIDRHLRELVELGALVITPRYDDRGDRTSNDYQLRTTPLTMRGDTHTDSDGLTAQCDTPLTTDVGTPLTTSGEENQSQLEPKENVGGTIVPPSANVPNSETPRCRARTPRDDLWDTLVACLGFSPTVGRAKSSWGKAVTDLTTLGATAEDINTRAERYRTRFGDDRFVHPRNLVDHWDYLGRGELDGARVRANGGYTPKELARMALEADE